MSRFQTVEQMANAVEMLFDRVADLERRLDEADRDKAEEKPKVTARSR